ncbi:MAG: hypothetical protein O2973_00585 [Gemmatimonadetes bacterium]|nr:hypothetical protein [Gemmatimonadota bacterium]
MLAQAAEDECAPRARARLLNSRNAGLDSILMPYLQRLGAWSGDENERGYPQDSRVGRGSTVG